MATTTNYGWNKPAATDTSGVRSDINADLDAIDTSLKAVADAAVAKALFDANTILAATTDNTPAALTVGASTIVGRKASGNIAALTPAEVHLILGEERYIDYSAFFNLTSGGPSTAEVPNNVALVMSYDQTSLERAATTIKLPNRWATYAVDLWWTNVAATTGDVVWKVSGSHKADTETVALGDTYSVSSGAIAAPTTIGKIKVTRLHTDIAAPDDTILSLCIERTADDVADTLANDAGMYGVNLVRLT